MRRIVVMLQSNVKNRGSPNGTMEFALGGNFEFLKKQHLEVRNKIMRYILIIENLFKIKIYQHGVTYPIINRTFHKNHLKQF